MFAALYRLACESQEVGLHCSTTTTTTKKRRRRRRRRREREVVKCNTSKLRTVKGKYI
jgi:hypothetical protein